MKYRKPIAGLGAKESVIVSFGRGVLREKKVRSETFPQAVDMFGYEGGVNLAAPTARRFRNVNSHRHQ